jgi:spoIIIJ-associated protein
MAQVVEVSGADVEDAVARALRQLGVNRGEVDVDVVREGRRGFLGFGSEETIVRVTVKEGVTPGAQRAPRGRRGGRGGRAPDRGTAPSAHESEEERQRREGAARAELEARELREEEAEAPTRPAREQRRRSGGRRGGRGRGRGGERDDRGGRRGDGRGPAARGGGATGAIELPVRVPGAPDEGPVAPIADPEDDLDLAGRTLRDLLTLLGLTETELPAREPETHGDGLGLMTQVFDVAGTGEEASDELGLLIGRRGETLQGLQYLLNVIVSSRSEGEQIFAVDVEQYRRRREQSLVELARRVADEVRTTGDVITLEPMPPAERRIVHLALQEEEGVATESVGQGSDRQVEVMPA